MASPLLEVRWIWSLLTVQAKGLKSDTTGMLSAKEQKKTTETVGNDEKVEGLSEQRTDMEGVSTSLPLLHS